VTRRGFFFMYHVHGLRKLTLTSRHQAFLTFFSLSCHGRCFGGGAKLFLWCLVFKLSFCYLIGIIFCRINSCFPIILQLPVSLMCKTWLSKSCNNNMQKGYILISRKNLRLIFPSSHIGVESHSRRRIFSIGLFK